MTELSELRFPNNVSVTDQKIDTSVLSDAQQQLYIQLFERIVKIYQSANQPRFVIGLAGPTGSGKSVMATLFKKFAEQSTLQFQFEVLGIDAFHYPNEFLLTHTSDKGTLKEVKGRYDTYDVSMLAHSLGELKSGKSVSLPIYSRKTHNPVENSIEITETNVLLLLEGLWVLRTSGDWAQVAQLLDYSIFVEADANLVRNAAIKRHMEGGRTAEDAANYYDTVDRKNFDLVIETKANADEIIPAYFYVTTT